LIAANSLVHWVPGHLKDGRFGKWIEGARDWAISRNRYWGTPLPVWRSDDGEEKICVGSIEELEELSGSQVSDLHKHIVDEIEIPSGEGRGGLRRVPEVLDCWFESGAMPYAQAHYPFENREHFETHFPADFIAEGIDQTRGWFYTLMVLSVALFDKPAFKNVVVNGMVLAKDGRKMSKRLKNYPDPVYMLNTYGADAVRLYMLNSSVVKAEDLRFSEDGVSHLLRHILIPLWNAYAFFVTYANIDGWKTGAEQGAASPNVLDRWIRSSLESLSEKVVAAMDRYDLQQAVRPFVKFIEDLTNWYIRRSRRRFWKSQDDADKEQAYRTLSYVLLQLTRIAAPFIPFVSEAIYRNLKSIDMPDSVHLCDFPVADGGNRDPGLEEEMEEVMTVVRLGRLLRAENNLKVRQPLPVMHIVSRNSRTLERIKALEDIARDELNVKEVAYGAHETELVELSAKPDFSRLGPRLGPAVKKAAAAITRMKTEQLEELLDGKTARIEVDGEPVELTQEDLVIERIPREGLVAASEGPLVVVLETRLTGELVTEGLAREFVNKVQNMRKSAQMEVTQRIRLEFSSDEDVAQAVETHGEYIKAETLCLECLRIEEKPNDATDWDINGRPCAVRILAVEK